MDTQLTPYHNKLWNSGFLLLQCANVLLSFVFYALMGLLPKLTFFYSADTTQLGVLPVGGVAVLCMAVGISLSGPYVGWLVERFRRNRMFVYSTCLLAVCLVLLPFSVRRNFTVVVWLLLLSLCVGMLYGVAGRVLTCTLIIDKTESFNRTQAGLVSSAASLVGALAGLASVFILCRLPMLYVEVFFVVVLLLAVVCVRVLRFPFRAPIETARPFSLDRFFQPSAWPWFCCMALAAGFVGFLAGRYHGIMPGTRFLSEVLLPIVGFGILANRILKIMTERGSHCQRGTLLSTCFMAQNAGIPLGFALAQMI